MPTLRPNPDPGSAHAASEASLSISNATSLLWAKQLKREHAYLQDRMKTVEGQLQAYDKRIIAAEALTKSMAGAQDMEQLSSRVTLLEQPGESNEWIDGALDRLQRMEDEVQGLRSVQQDIKCLESRIENSRKTDEQALSSCTHLLSKVNSIEACVREGKHACVHNVRNGEQELEALRFRFDVMQLAQSKETKSIEALSLQLESILHALQAQGIMENRRQSDDAAGSRISIPANQEAATGRHTFSQPAQIQVPASPWSSSSSLSEPATFPVSPMASLEHGKVKKNAGVNPRPKVLALGRLETPDLDGPYRHINPEPANTSRKRKVVPSTESDEPKTGLQTLSAGQGEPTTSQSRLVVLKMPLKEKYNRVLRSAKTTKAQSDMCHSPVELTARSRVRAKAIVHSNRSVRRNQGSVVPLAVPIPEGHPMKRKWVRRDLSNWN